MHIGEKETKWLFVILITSGIFVGGIGGFAETGGTAAWIVSAVCSVFALLFFWVLEKLKGRENISIFDLMQKSYGEVIAFLLGIALTFFSILNSAARLEMFSSAITDIILPDSPRIYILLFFGAVMIAAASLGIEALTRYALPVGIFITILLAVIVVFNFDGYRISNILPIFGKVGDEIEKSFCMTGIFTDFFYLYILSDFFRKKGALKRVGLKAVLLSSVIITAATFFYVLRIPYPASESFDYPLFRLSSLANTSVLFQRIDAAVYVIWLFSGFITASALSLFSMMIFAKTFKTEDAKGIMYMMIFVILALSLDNDLNFNLANLSFSIFASILLLVTILVYRLKNSVGRAKNEK